MSDGHDEAAGDRAGEGDDTRGDRGRHVAGPAGVLEAAVARARTACDGGLNGSMTGRRAADDRPRPGDGPSGRGRPRGRAAGTTRWLPALPVRRGRPTTATTTQTAAPAGPQRRSPPRSSRDDPSARISGVGIGVEHAEAGAQVDHRLGVDLGHPGLGDAEDPADLGQGQALEVVEAAAPFARVRAARDRLAEELAGVGPLEVPRSPPSPSVGRGCRRARRHLARVEAEHLVQRGQAGLGDLGERPTGARGRSIRVRRPAPRRWVPGGARTRASRTPFRSAVPVPGRSGAPSRSSGGRRGSRPGSGRRRRTRTCTPGRFELVDGVDQPEHAVAHQVGLLDVPGQSRPRRVRRRTSPAARSAGSAHRGPGCRRGR